MGKGWIGVDLDGTLAFHKPGDGVDQVGRPIPRMIAFVRKLIEEGETIKIMTARVSGDDRDHIREQTRLIQEWCTLHLGQPLEVTCSKDFNMICLYDDRAIQVISNTGIVISVM